MMKGALLDELLLEGADHISAGEKRYVLQTEISNSRVKGKVKRD